ncbi:hypothetical protein MP213Fo_04970 [Pseudochrobactrum sp. MP213Fo]
MYESDAAETLGQPASVKLCCYPVYGASDST